MAELQIEHYNIERLLTELELNGEPLDKVADIWNAFIKWSKMNFDVERTINIPHLGNFAFRLPHIQGEEMTLDKEKSVLFYPNENFLNSSNLRYRGEIETPTPTIKISYHQIAKLCGGIETQVQQTQKINDKQLVFTKQMGVDRSLIQAIVEGVFSSLIQKIKTKTQIEVDLGYFGKFLRFDFTFTYEPLLKSKVQSQIKQGSQTKKTVRNLIEQSKNAIALQTRGQITNFQMNKNSMLQQQNEIIQQSIEQSQIIQTKKAAFEIFSENSQQKMMQTPTRRIGKLEHIPVMSEMLGAGTDPLAKNQDFSKLVENPFALMSQQFIKPQNAKIRFPPILDKFARTLAAPISGMKYNSSVVGRIASNYNPGAKRFYFDSESKGVRILRAFESKVNFTANPELLQKPASLEEELLYVTGKLRTKELKEKLEAKNNCYARYQAYINNEIPQEFIAEIKQQWVQDIIELLPRDLKKLGDQLSQKYVEEMMNEITHDYNLSMKKAILDYVLKDDEERLRVGIVEIIDEIPEYGSAVYKGIEPSEEWKKKVNEARDAMVQNLVINSQTTLQLLKSWYAKYSKMNFLVLSSAKDQPMNINYFTKVQQDRIQEVKNHLQNEWHKEVADLYQKELHVANRNKRHAMLFFESTATLMSNLLRTQINESLISYRNFFKRFDKKILRIPQQVIAEEDDFDKPIEDVFLTVKLKHDGNKIEFADHLQMSIKNGILKLIDDIYKCSENFQRPENTISRSEKTSLWKIPEDDDTFVSTYKTINEILDINLKNVESTLEIYEKYSFLLKETEKATQWASVPRARNEFIQAFNNYSQLYEQVNEAIPFFVRVNMILVDGCEVKKKYLDIIQEIIQLLERNIHDYIMTTNQRISKEIQALQDNIQGRADTTERLVELEAALEKIRKTENKKVQNDFIDLQKWLYQLYTTNYQINEDDLIQISNTSRLVHSLMFKVDQEEIRIQKDRDQLEQFIRERREKFQHNLDEITQNITRLKTSYTSAYQVKEANDIVDNHIKRLQEYVAEMQDIQMREEQLGWQPTEFVKLQDAQNSIKPYEELWHQLRDWEQNSMNWTKAKFIFRLDAESIEKDVKTMLTQAKKLTYQFPKNTTPQGTLQLIKQLSDKINDFQVQLPMIRVFSNPGMKERHWEEISQIMGFPVRPDKEQQLSKLIELDLKQHFVKFEEISDSATKEYNLEKILNKMQEDWDNVITELKPWKDTGTFIVSGASNDEVQTLLDDQIVKTITMKGSPYARNFESRIAEWEAFLYYTQSLFDYWLKVQGVWMYLEPVFTSPDILKHLATEGTRFKEVDASWKSIINKVNSNPKVIEYTKNRKMLDILKECNASLEVCQKGLNSYLEGKRTNFPRFYFLSNDELLEILSETKDPQRVQPHLKKCFEGIQKLKIDGEKKIHGMYSSESEYVQFQNIVDTNAARGNVDEWLVEVEKKMIECIRYQTEKAYKEYSDSNRKSWVINRCGMAVLNMDMTFWTSETERNMLEKGNEGVGQYAAVCTQQLYEIVALVRTEISVLDRCTLEAMIVLDVHNRDVLNQLFKENVEKVNEFSWQAQLRYYWIDNNTTVRIINAICEYNYEYLGNSARLVITPLTDRCYRTLCGAIHLNYGGAPEGPAGTGKTETVKDLAKALARQCVVFNCSDGLDYKAMGKFFKGLASSGAWSCFDEFNRIDLEVLSVVAQQILTIQIARASNKSSFTFEGSDIRLIQTCNCFITMNPGYAGRSELPDNLKALFRSVAMMVPNYEMIAEISLYSYGFSQARDLARKIVTTYQLCSEQLSSQDHYDYGMRAVKSVLTAAGNLKRKFQSEDEFILMLRAINDVNLAKFLSFDLPLFQGITNDLFPGIKLPEIDYKNMYECINIEIDKLNLQKVPDFIVKVIQLYEMILVRHGLMVVGLPFGGKTSAIKVLAGALTLLNERNQMNEKKVQIITLNPKSVTMKELYGKFDEVSHEWYDGVLAVKFRQFAKGEDDDRKWLIFDGPIDAVWIENMNTVLDDNKKLCLNSGEIIAMSKAMNMIFEPMDLQAASPATVSRCGMIYMEPQIVGWNPLQKSWMNTLPKVLLKEDLEEIQELYDAMMEPLMEFHTHQRMASEKYEISPCQNANLLVSHTKLFKSLLQVFDDEQLKALDSKIRQGLIQQLFVFALIWSFGASVSTDFRKPFDQFMKRLCGGDIHTKSDAPKKKVAIPDRGSLFDYIFELKQNKSDGEWVLWTQLIDKNEQISPKLQPHEILVKTTDTVRYSYWLLKNIFSGTATIFCGPTGTGKSVYIKNVLAELPKGQYSAIELGFSAQTTSTQTQFIIDQKLERIRKGFYGPRIGNYVLFVDDLNMPAKEKWGAQPPIEILRQFLDQGGWYDNGDKEKMFKSIINCVFVTAMGPPGGGRTFVTPRILRHLSLISLAAFDDETLNRIFGSILKWFFTNQNFPQDILKMESKIVNGTLEIYKLAMRELLPTPTKSHYLFNLRDFAKVILGICLADKDKINTTDVMARLWTHEVWRVFADRLINDDDRLLMLRSVREIMRKSFGLNFDTIFEHLDKPDVDGKKDNKIDQLDEIRGLIFTDVMTPMGAPKRFYEEVIDQAKLANAVDQQLQNYNDLGDKPMDLVLFQFAIEHLLVITRIMKQPGGNALLVGVGGSGRQSLARLASSIGDFKVVQIEISKSYGKTEWHEDIKKLLKQCGGKNDASTFLFTDNQIKLESFVEDVNNLLNTSEVPNIFPTEEKTEVTEMVRPAYQSVYKEGEATLNQLYAFFLERVKKNLHIILCMSPIGDAFRTRVRMFPSLVNCCTIDWFNEWPQDALVSVATRFLKPVEMDERIKQECIDMVQFFHQSTMHWAKKFYDDLKRKYYVTPTSYLELIVTFKSLLYEKRNEVTAQINKYRNGLSKITTTENNVEGMKTNLIQLQPQLKDAAEKTKIKMDEVQKEKIQADSLKTVIQSEEAVVQEAVDKANAIKEECEAELSEAMPALKAAQDALNVLDKKQIEFLKQMKAPSMTIRNILRALCLLLYPNPTEKIKDKDGIRLVTDWWTASLKVLGRSTLLEEMVSFNTDTVEEKVIVSLGKYMQDPEYKDSLELSAAENASPACKVIMMWINGVYNFYFVNKKVKPKKIALAESQAQVDGLNSKLAVKQKELNDANEKVSKLNKELQLTVDNKNRLENEYDECSKQLERAKKLIESLGGEKGRWGSFAEQLEANYITLTGDVLTSAGMIAYSGAFTQAFRIEIVKEWVAKCVEKSIPSSQIFSLLTVLGEPVKIRAWNIDGLPSDQFSIENSIILFKARRWPLCIDPQGQANKWIKKMEQQRKIAIIKLSDSDFLRQLENAIQFGKPVLLENVLEELDASLTPILLKQVFTKGNTTYIKLGENTIEYSNQFQFYITTKLRNPHYLPEISTKVTLLNFMITYEGLSDQLLGILVKKERPDLEREKERLIMEGASNKKQLAEIEQKILEVLSGNKNILTDETAIEILTASKLKSNEISEKQIIAEQTEKNIDTARQEYVSVAQQASCLFFVISDLNNIDPMYQYSLVYFIDLFTQSIVKSDKSDNIGIRLENLKNYFLLSLYRNICRSLFEKDKLLFSFLLATRVMEFRKQLDQEAFRFLMTGGLSLQDKMPDQPKADWVLPRNWGEITRLSLLPTTQGFHEYFYKDEYLNGFKRIYDSLQPQSEDLPGELKDKYTNPLIKLCVLRCIRPDKLIPAIQIFVHGYLGEEFIFPPAFNLAEIYEDSSSVTPLIFVLSPGSDPFASLSVFANTKNKSFAQISLGQGQGPLAQKLISEGVINGSWVVLQNCHLAVSWMNTLEKICEELSPDPKQTHPEFRLWLTSYPSPQFPTAILQAGIKMTNEPPKGLKANLQGSFLTDPISNDEFFSGCNKPEWFKRLLFGLCFFHAVIQERRKYGPLGWNIPYEFNESDLRICVRQLRMFLDENDQVPFEALRYLTAECNYGGRVTDDKDRNLIKILLEDYYCPQVIDEDQKYNFGYEQYNAPHYETREEYLDHIKQLPLLTPPQIFGFHPNADITKDMNETNLILESLLLCSAQGSSSSGQSFEQVLEQLVKTIMTDFPDEFNYEQATEKYPFNPKESMNTVLTQELTRFNKLINIIRKSMDDLKLALMGKILMSPQLERASRQLFDGKVPDLWMEKSYPSLKPLGSYVIDLKARLNFFQKWLDNGIPYNYWLSGFFFTQSYLTGVLQNFARKYIIPIDEIKFEYKIMDQSIDEHIESRPDDGAYVWGLYIEGAKWNFNTMELDESDPKVLFTKCPTIQLCPMHISKINPPPTYNCPLYKTSARRGVLSTTGHSTNFVMFVRLYTSKPERFWVKRGVALLTQLDD
ncbi:unnamed protein product [Paramecium pentaurelia]|uniref:AAA+ ATPase domain-containing protein n=1 Tax=Paramecium pentaurelia TaxID=43138 RepID=A0A8S1UBH2_9CILI|nr:unnamed protein product [Paramecium pentaurelia]